ncbi:MAG: hypothetical protein WA821_10590 [Anaerolineales bacterium]
MNEDELEIEAEKERTVLLAVNSKGARLLPYTLADVEELAELISYLLSPEGIPEDLKADALSALEAFQALQNAPREEKLINFLERKP